jgi:hypothetical protein
MSLIQLMNKRRAVVYQPHGNRLRAAALSQSCYSSYAQRVKTVGAQSAHIKKAAETDAGFGWDGAGDRTALGT